MSFLKWWLSGFLTLVAATALLTACAMLTFRFPSYVALSSIVGLFIFASHAIGEEFQKAWERRLERRRRWKGQR